jgi:hypothetical protein
MQDRFVGNIRDFGKLALLRYLMGRQKLAVSWYLTNGESGNEHDGKTFDYLKRPDEFRHLAPEVFDALASIIERTPAGMRGVEALEASGLLAGATFHRTTVPRPLGLRRRWSEQLVRAVHAADLVFLDPDNGIEGTRLSPKHVALSELVALRRHDRALVFVQRQTGRPSEVSFLANRLWSIGCKRIELVRFRLVASRFCVVTDHDDAMAERIAGFARKWGKWVTTYRP